MSNTMRWRYGDTNPVLLEAPSDSEIEIGDLLYLDSGVAKPASSFPDQSTLLLNQVGLKADFAGVAMQASPAGMTGMIRVATTGVFEMECDLAPFEVGDLIGVTENSAGDQLLDQSVELAGSISAAIGRCAKRVNPASTRVLVDLVSTVAKGGAYAA